MNIKRGLHRLFVVSALAWYLIFGFNVWLGWSTYFSFREGRLAQCIEASQQQPKPDNAVTEQECRQYYGSSFEPAMRSENWIKTVELIVVPWLVYIAGRIIAWIIRGFRSMG